MGAGDLSSPFGGHRTRRGPRGLQSCDGQATEIQDFVGLPAAQNQMYFYLAGTAWSEERVKRRTVWSNLGEKKYRKPQYSLNPYYEKLDIFAQFNSELYFDVRKR